MKKDDLDDKRLSEASAKLAEATSKRQEAFVNALRKIHDLLEPEQRTRLAPLIREMPTWIR